MAKSKRYDTVKKWYDLGKWSTAKVRDAVTSMPQWITAEEFEEITGQNYEDSQE